VGDLLYAAVSAQTPAGLEAQRHMDANKGCVPDCILLDLLLARLQQPDCIAQGWVLDGFPHTKKQVNAAVDVLPQCSSAARVG
jgi:adenylate kinase